jgi:hypothetical protein
MANPFDWDDVPQIEPDNLVKGVRFAWKIKYDEDVLSTDYVLVYKYTPITVSGTFEIVGSFVDDFWRFELLGDGVNAAENGEYRYDLVIRRISDNEEHIVSTGYTELFSNAGDRRTHAEVMVQKIQSVLEGRADHDVASYTIRTRSITKMTVDELVKWRDYYLDEIARTGGSTLSTNKRRKNRLITRFS